MEKIENNMDFFVDYRENLEAIQNKLLSFVEDIAEDKIEHLKYRIKSDDSTKAKLIKRNHEPTAENAIKYLSDIIGVRIVCRFWNDVFDIARAIENNSDFRHIESKNYIDTPKENGYRSYHIILEIEHGGLNLAVEVQIRTISQDSWASLEHKMKYKKEIENQNLIKMELKRLADEMASTDICMQTIKELIEN